MRTKKVVNAVIEIVRAIHKSTKSNTGLIKLRKYWNNRASSIMGITNPKIKRVCIVVTPFLDSIFI